jgi:BirA family biotin operon repressor/biotin-[acetyl-CoA-carboxylase] ligase
LAFGLAAVQAVDLVLPRGAAELKWPNDVMVAGHKIGGLLAQVAPTGELVVGLGLNVHQSEAELAQIDSTGPPPGSLATVGAPDVDRDWLGIAYLAAAAQLYQRWERAEADLLRLISARVGTIGQEVDIRLPDGGQVRGRAEALAADGTLKVRVAGGQTVSVLGGDLTTAPTSSPGPAPQ